MLFGVIKPRNVAGIGILSTIYKVVSARTDMLPTVGPPRAPSFTTSSQLSPSLSPSPSTLRFKSTAAAANSPALQSWQLSCWSTYLSNGLGSDNLFRSIDLDHDNKISAGELKVFLESVNNKGVHPRAFKMLHELASDHGLTIKEFKSWLILATKFGYERNSTFALDYQRYREVGERRPAVETDDEDYHSWNEATMSQSIRKMQYAVRGQIVMRADELKAEGKDILMTNIGNPQAVGQNPITFYRQVMALADLPAAYGVDHPEVAKMFPSDVIKRARQIHEHLGGADGSGTTGAYTGSQGALGFRRDVARFIEERDGHPAYAGNIFLTNGASSGIEIIMQTLLGTEVDGIMIPLPQYPIYSALCAKMTGRQIGYYLDEENNWAVSPEELQERLEEARQDAIDVKALVIINPGNPTGQVFSRKDLEVICKFCADNGIVLLADEVYQRNVYNPDKKFISAKKVAMETPGCESLQLVSFHSTSKGTIGECGRRGGYMELHNIDPYVHSQLYKLASSILCPNVPGQIMTSLMVNPPKPGDESYELYEQEETGIFEGLKRRSKALVDGLNAVDGIKCNSADGAMYAFPSVEIPQKAIEYAEEHDMTPDFLYALSLLDSTGICVVPASGFGQKEGRYGFRTTFLPPDDQMIPAIEKFAEHHKEFVKRFS